jgi:ATPase family associated with various cellular activities (AAA)/AAA+ lid domain
MSTSSTGPTGFDAFFQSITNSPEFRDFTKAKEEISDLAWLEASLATMQADVEKASNLMKNFDEKFIPQSPSPWINNKSDWTVWTMLPKTWDAKSETDTIKVEVQRFTRVEGKPWGFEAVAGMDDLKEELKDSFIKPLRFKFMVEKMRSQNLLEKGGGTNETSNGGLVHRKIENPIPLSQSDISLSQGSKNALLERLYAEYEKYKISIPTGMLFYGPPGTGKTFITRKLAEELGCGFISKNMGEFGSSYLHQTTKNIKDFFEWTRKAAENEPIILFLDEIDSLVSKRTSNVDANKAEEVSQFLQEFNSLELSPNLIVIAATNRPDHLDPAILRSGRLDKKIYLGPPDIVARKALFQMYIERKWRPSKKLDYDELAKITDGYVSADIEAICDEVARDASRGLLDLIDEAESGTLTEKNLRWNEISMESIKSTLAETPSSLKMVDMSIYESWLEKIK